MRIGFTAPPDPPRPSTFGGEAPPLQFEVVDDGIGLPVIIDDCGPGFLFRRHARWFDDCAQH
ncbi:hypothetical protein ABCR94_13120 [Streptomyces sp. 21So2-11]|uniref:hypothetical protein n=1 Tax=Streptomyces sp. 21So2-11 TaxID=3144408 RepID=UPI00321C0C11